MARHHNKSSRSHNGKKHRIPSHQVEHWHGRLRKYITSGTASLSTTFWNGTQQQPIYFEKASSPQSDGIFLEMDMKVTTAAVTPAPVIYWGTKFELINRNGTRVLQEFYPETILESYKLLPLERQRKYAKMGMFDPDSWRHGPQLEIGTHKAYLFLPFSFFDLGLVDMTELQSDIELRLTPRGDPLVSGTKANFTMTGHRFVSDAIEHETDKVIHHAHHVKHIDSGIILDTDIMEIPAATYTAGQSSQIQINGFTGQYVCLSFFLISSTLNTAGASQKYISLGRSQIDLLSPGTQRIYTSGAGVSAEIIQNQLTGQHYTTDQDEKLNIYTLSFSHDLKKSYYGGNEGRLDMWGKNHRINIQFDTVGQTVQQTVTVDAKATGGSYTLSFKGETTAPIAYDAAVAVIAAALNLLPSMRRSNVFCSAVTGTLSAGTTLVLTLTQCDGVSPINPEALVTAQIDAATTTANSLTTLTRTYLPGFVTGSYSAIVYAQKKRRITRHGKQLYYADLSVDGSSKLIGQ